MSGPHFAWQDPLEAPLLPAVSAEELMGHARAIASWERESGTAGEAQAFDYIEGCLKRFGLAIERREIEAYISLPLEARIVLPDGTSLPALTHSFSTTTPPEGLEAELVEGGEGTGEALARAGATGKLALIDGFATPGKAWTAQEAGTLGQIFVSLDHLHNMIVTTIWGTPTPETASRIPRLPCCSILRADAERLRALLARGPLRVRGTIDATLEPMLRPAAPLTEYAWRYRYPGEPFAPSRDEVQVALGLARDAVDALIDRLPAAAR